MVHNGIEYGDMQLICEAYAILKNVLGSEAKDLADISHSGIAARSKVSHRDTAEIFSQTRSRYRQSARVDVTLDKAGQKGTGLWTLPIRPQSIGRHLNLQRRSGSACHFLA